MMKKTNILTVSMIAIMAVGAVRADIASTSYVNTQIQPVSQALNSKENVANKVSYISGDDYANMKTGYAEMTDEYPSVATVGTWIKDKTDTLGGQMAGKQEILLSSGAGANVSVAGNGNVITAVSAPGDGSITFTKGTTLGSLATKSTVTSSDITDGTITSSDISGSAGITKGQLASGVQESLDAADAALSASTYNTQIGTVSAANMGSTATTVVGAIGEINDTTNTNSLKSRIGKAEGDISQLGEQISTLSSDSQVKSSEDYQVGNSSGGWTTLDVDQIAAINSGATDTLIGKISTNEAAINTLNGSGAGSVANSIASALTPYSTTAQMNTELAKKQNTIDNDHKLATNLIATSSDAQFVTASEKSTWSGKQDALTAGDRITITTDAQTGNLVISAADQSYSDTALSNRVTAIEDSAAYKSGIDSTKVAQIATNASDISDLQSGKQDKIDAQHKLSTDLIANDAGFITKDVNDLTNYTTTTAMNTSLSGKQPVSSGVSVGGANGSWNSLTNGSGITITTSDGTTTIATATSYVPMPSAAGTTGRSVLTYDSTANNGAGAYYWEEIGR